MIKAIAQKIKFTFAIVVPKKAAIALFGTEKTVLGIKDTTMICNKSGVPRMIQMSPLTRYFRGLNFDIEPKDIISPKGIAKTSVIANSNIVSSKPCKSFNMISPNVISP